jgi:predicted CXXCH cytochrome family protein
MRGLVLAKLPMREHAHFRGKRGCTVKRSRVLPMLMVNAAIVMLTAGTDTARAFHSGGVGECEGCHTMHNYQRGGAVGSFLLRGSDSSSVCLNCHQVPNDLGPTTFHVSTPSGEMPAGVAPKQLTPGGDFGWLKKSYNWSLTSWSYGDSHGHNIVAQDYGYLQDSVNIAAPGGSYPANSLSCISCHDPHGRYRRNVDGTVTTTGKPIKASGSFSTSPDPDPTAAVGVYRLLGGAGYLPKNLSPVFAFGASAPAAVAPLVANRSEASSYTRVAYGSGMSEWCKNCHPNIHDGVNSFKHLSPTALSASYADTVGQKQPYMSDWYNSYLNTGDVTTAFLSLVPFEAGTNNYAILKGIAAINPGNGPDSNAAAMCLSCHRAHAGGWDGIMRWNPKTDAIVTNGKYAFDLTSGQGRTEAEALAAYYQIPESRFNPNQPKLCFKCHSTLP